MGELENLNDKIVKVIIEAVVLIVGLVILKNIIIPILLTDDDSVLAVLRNISL